jgi:hypothetical protein
VGKSIVQRSKSSVNIKVLFLLRKVPRGNGLETLRGSKATMVYPACWALPDIVLARILGEVNNPQKLIPSMLPGDGMEMLVVCGPNMQMTPLFSSYVDDNKMSLCVR